MAKSFASFMEKIIDYAGLFPPATLHMEQAIRNFSRYRTSRDAWMLSRFICPAARLKELYPFKESLFSEENPVPLSVLGRSGKSEKEFLSGIRKDLVLINEFLSFMENGATVELFEVRLPASLFEKPAHSVITTFLNRLSEELEYGFQSPVIPFYEAPLTRNWKSTFSAVVKGIAEHNFQVLDSAGYQFYQPAGFKLRCGGTEPGMYPAPQQVAYAIDLCQRYRVALKTTAGLHHPVRHFDETGQVTMHGFFNVFGAGILADAHQLEEEQITEIIADENPEDFMFTRNAFAWKNLRASVEEIQKARRERLISFGSCSFDEPREDLRRMKLL